MDVKLLRLVLAHGPSKDRAIAILEDCVVVFDCETGKPPRSLVARSKDRTPVEQAADRLQMAIDSGYQEINEALPPKILAGIAKYLPKAEAPKPVRTGRRRVSPIKKTAFV